MQCNALANCCFCSTGREEEPLPGAPARHGRPFLCEALMATRWWVKREEEGSCAFSPSSLFILSAFYISIFPACSLRSFLAKSCNFLFLRHGCLSVPFLLSLSMHRRVMMNMDLQASRLCNMRRSSRCYIPSDTKDVTMTHLWSVTHWKILYLSLFMVNTWKSSM